MTTAKRTTPVWGKTLGIIMIILGGFGIFYNLYKMVVPAIFRAQQKMMDHMSEVAPDKNEVDRVQDVFDEFIGINELTENLLFIFAIIGAILCIAYIFGGVKLLKAKPENYNFAKWILIISVVIGITQCVTILSTASGFMVFAFIVYGIIGVLFDIVILIILLASNKANYGIGTDEELTNYTDSNQDEIL